MTEELKVYRFGFTAWFEHQDFPSDTQPSEGISYVQGRNLNDARNNAKKREPELATRMKPPYRMYLCNFYNFEEVQVPNHKLIVEPLEQKVCRQKNS